MDTIFDGWKCPQKIGGSCWVWWFAEWFRSSVDSGLRSKYWYLWRIPCRNVGHYEGMKLTWRLVVTHLYMESDSKLLINMVIGRCNLSGATSILIRWIHKLISPDWHTRFQHTWREDNSSADWLARYSMQKK
jgi:hypothetical protein